MWLLNLFKRKPKPDGIANIHMRLIDPYGKVVFDGNVHEEETVSVNIQFRIDYGAMRQLLLESQEAEIKRIYKVRLTRLENWNKTPGWEMVNKPPSDRVWCKGCLLLAKSEEERRKS